MYWLDIANVFVTRRVKQIDQHRKIGHNHMMIHYTSEFWRGIIQAGNGVTRSQKQSYLHLVNLIKIFWVLVERNVEFTSNVVG